MNPVLWWPRTRARAMHPISCCHGSVYITVIHHMIQGRADLSDVVHIKSTVLSVAIAHDWTDTTPTPAQPSPVLQQLLWPPRGSLQLWHAVHACGGSTGEAADEEIAITSLVQLLLGWLR